MNILITICARGGSKGIPFKNLFPLNNKPLIEYTFEIARQLKLQYGDLIFPFLSTDDDRILEFGKDQEIFNEYVRPSELAGDKSTIVDGLLHAIDWLENKKGISTDAILLLQPTSPIRVFSELKNMIDLFIEKKYESMFSVIPMKQHPYECIVKEENEWSYLAKPKIGQQRQSYNNIYYFIDGSYYLVSKKFIEKNRTFIIPEISVPFVLKNKNTIDIDEVVDVKFAEIILKNENE